MRKSILNLAHQRAQGQHPGLLLQRYLVCQDDEPVERSKLLCAVIDAAQSESLRTLYTSAFARWAASFPENELHCSAHFCTANPLIVGLGSENILETGLRLHHTYGVPVIPGSALKGLASHYCHGIWGLRHAESVAEENKPFRREGSYHRLLFGSTDDGGVITFHNAWITPDSLCNAALRLDVMTPHHPQWQTGDAPPTDFDSPKPISFLSVTGVFEVRLSWSGPADMPADQAESWIKLTMMLLQEALSEWGIGGKTSSGYGRLIRVENRVQQARLPSPGETVEARLLEERTRKGGWKARHEQTGLSGPIQNSGEVLGENKAGDTLNLIVAIANERELAFRYPTPADEKRAQQRSKATNRHSGSKRPGGSKR